jgi:type VI secretion system protein ImpA
MTIDIAALLAPVSDEAPCGEAVEYDPQFNELETLARGTPEQEVGDTIIPAEEPDWREVARIAQELAARSKDLRVALYLLRAELKLSGMPGLAQGLELIKGYLEQYWPGVHPQLDPEDDNDPSARVNALVSLCDPELMLRSVRTTPLTQSRQFGRVTYRDHAIATGLLPMPTPKPGQEEEKIPDSSAIDAGFADTAVETLQGTQAAVDGALENLDGIEAALSGVLGSVSGPDLEPLRKLLREIKGLVDHQVALRGSGEEAASEEAAAAGGGAMATSAASGGSGASGVIRGRSDVALLLDKICRYYAEHEPSSPVPLLLERAKRLVTMNFLEILNDLTPDGVQQFGVIAGIKPQEEQNY